MNTPTDNASAGWPLVEADPDATYTIDLVAELTGVSSQTILQYQEHGLISPVAGSESAAHQFDADALRALRRLEHLRTTCEMNLSGLKLMLSLLEEVDALRNALRARR